jgi:hypothetical protein
MSYLSDDVSDGDICATYNISIVTTAVDCAYTLSTTATRVNAGHVFCRYALIYMETHYISFILNKK